MSISDTLSDDSIAAKALDKPILVGQSVVMEAAENEALFAAKWSDTLTTATDRTETGFPATNAADGFHHRPTKPSTAETPTEWFFLVDLGADKVYDTFVITLDNVSGNVTLINLYEHIAAGVGANPFDDAFNDGSIASFGTILDNTRRVELSLGGGNNEFTSRFLVVEFTGSPTQPAITELYLGRRRQMTMFPDRPFDERPFGSNINFIESGGGVLVPYVRSNGQLRAAVTFTGANSTQKGLLTSWWDDSKQGIKPSCWIPEPNSSPDRAYFVYQRSGFLTVPTVGPGPFKSRAVLDLVESAPFVKTET